MARRPKKTQDPNQEQQDQQAQEDVRKVPVEGEGGEPTRTGPTFHPRVDIVETQAGLIILADMPGATPDSVHITLERRQLTIRGDVESRAPGGMSALYLEYDIGAWERSFTLSGDFDIEKIEAGLRDGVLTLTLPRAPEPKAKRVQIKAG